jgi:hypothetical protein
MAQATELIDGSQVIENYRGSGNTYILYGGLLDLAHRKGLEEIETEFIQIPSAENGQVTIIRATARGEEGRFQGIGEASPEDGNPVARKHPIRMAETRAKARALRDYDNIEGAVDESEVQIPGEIEEILPNNEPTEDVVEAVDPDEIEGVEKGGAQKVRGSSGKARKSQVDLLKTLAVEWRGEGGVERLENRIGKPLTELTRAEADEWIDRLTPEGR